MNSRPSVIVIGSGGHAKVVVDALLHEGLNVIGITDADPSKNGNKLLGVSIIGDDAVLDNYNASDIELALGIGTIKANSPRKKIFSTFKSRDFNFATVIHPSAIIGNEVNIGEGAQILSGAVVHPGATIGMGAIINFGARIDHDCNIGEFAHIAPGATLSGGTKIGNGAHVGTGASIIQGITIGAHALVAAGATVVRDVNDNERVAGVPAKLI